MLLEKGRPSPPIIQCRLATKQVLTPPICGHDMARLHTQTLHQAFASDHRHANTAHSLHCRGPNNVHYPPASLRNGVQS